MNVENLACNSGPEQMILIFTADSPDHGSDNKGGPQTSKVITFLSVMFL